MYKPGLTKKDLAEMEAAGLSPDDYEQETVEAWPENWPAYLLFAFMRTQWRVGGMSVVGLDYGTLYRKMDRMDLSPDEYSGLESDVQVMEYEALGIMNARRE